MCLDGNEIRTGSGIVLRRWFNASCPSVPHPTSSILCHFFVILWHFFHLAPLFPLNATSLILILRHFFFSILRLLLYFAFIQLPHTALLAASSAIFPVYASSFLWPDEWPLATFCATTSIYSPDRQFLLATQLPPCNAASFLLTYFLFATPLVHLVPSFIIQPASNTRHIHHASLFKSYVILHSYGQKKSNSDNCADAVEQQRQCTETNACLSPSNGNVPFFSSVLSICYLFFAHCSFIFRSFNLSLTFDLCGYSLRLDFLKQEEQVTRGDNIVADG